MHDVTQILSQIESGDPLAAEKLLPLLYDELRKLVAARMVNESADNTLQATALVHEAYVRLVGSSSSFVDRGSVIIWTAQSDVASRPRKSGVTLKTCTIKC